MNGHPLVLAFLEVGAWSRDDTWILVVGVLAAVACSLPGTFMVLRRMSMMGDAISHAVLPGLAAAFVLTIWLQRATPDLPFELPGWIESVIMMNARSGPVMFVGAAVVGLLTALFTQVLHQYGRVEQSAAMGVVFTSLFALGLILMVRAADDVDLDPGCVLYGAIDLAPFEVVNVFGMTMPRSAAMLAVITIINALFIIVFFKELKITSFDPVLATTLGLRANVMHYMLMTIIAITTVAAFESVGSILVVAMLIVPGATAHLLTDRLPSMIVVSVLIAAAGAAIGCALTTPGWPGAIDTNTAGMMVCATGGLFVLAMVAAPKHGLLSRFLRRTALTRQIVGEDALGLLYRLEEHDVQDTPLAFIARLRTALGIGPAMARLAMRHLQRRGLVDRGPDAWRLSEDGRRHAAQLVRAHRLWESYLVKHLSVPPDHVHDTAMKLEHVTPAQMREDLAHEADDPAIDPHGTRIPPPP